MGGPTANLEKVVKMGRPRAFSEAEALEAAVRVFWEKGYEGTSLDDLTRAIGINRSSLYASFGDKETLFRKVIARYSTGPMASLWEALQQPEAPRLAVLDWEMPGLDGLEVCRRTRSRAAAAGAAQLSYTYLLLLTDRRGRDHLVAGLDAGADDYLTKPFGTGELLARMRVALRHAADAAGPAVAQVVEAGGVRIDLASHVVTHDGHEVVYAHFCPDAWSLSTSARNSFHVFGGLAGSRPAFLKASLFQ